MVSLERVLIRIKQHGLTTRPDKCKVGFTKLNYLGFVLGEDEIAPQESKTSAIQEIPIPSSKKRMRSFLGMISFYRKFIPNAAALSSPLSDMLR